MWRKSKYSPVWLKYISITLNLTYYKNNLYKTLVYWSRENLNFNFLKEGLGIVSTLYFVYEFLTKMLLMLYSINLPNCIIWLPLLIELGNMCIDLFVYQVATSWILKLIFLTKPFSYMTKKSRQKLKNFENEKSF